MRILLLLNILNGGVIMNNMMFSVPFNNHNSTLIEILKLKKMGENKIREIYLSVPQEYSGSGRIIEEIETNKFLETIENIHKEGLRVNLVLNSTCEGAEWYFSEVINKKIDFLNRMHNTYGVEAVTIANPLYIQEISRLLPDIEICASVLCDIDSVQKAQYFKKAGANTITPDVNINRNLPLLKTIKKTTNLQIKLMANEGCLHKCPLRKFHFNYISHQSKELTPIKGDAFFANCTRISLNDNTQILKSGWIRPEDLPQYSEVTNYFKIAGRSRPKSHVVRTVRAYLEQRWDGDLLDILCSSLNKLSLEYGANLDNKALGQEDNFFSRITSSDENSIETYCKEMAKKLIRFGVVTPEKLDDLGHHDLAKALRLS